MQAFAKLIFDDNISSHWNSDLLLFAKTCFKRGEGIPDFITSKLFRFLFQNILKKTGKILDLFTNLQNKVICLRVVCW